MMANQYVKLLPWTRNYLLLGAAQRKSSSNVISSSTSNDQIIIPKRIPRSDTDILKALSSTLGSDPTAPAFKYIDDPFLIPNNKHQKLVYSMSKESGRKAAKYFMNKFPEYFFRDEAEPKIEAFHFKELFEETMDLNEKDLLYAIENNQMDNAMIAFKTIKSKDGNISDDTKKKLLESICYFNSLEAPDPDLREKFISERVSDSIWICDFAFEVFDSMEEKSGEAYGIMIAGLCRHFSIERALQIFTNSKENDLVLTIEAYNALISTCIRSQSFENRWSLITDIVNDMNRRKVAPNLVTFANIFDILSRCKPTTQLREKARGLMAEMSKYKIEPSLGIYHDLLRIHTNGTNRRPRILEEILEDLGDKELVMMHDKDALFFSSAMQICSYVLSDVQLAYKLHNLVTSNQNYLLLGTTDSENRYYNNFFKLIIKSEPIDRTMEIYYRYVPNIYVPDTTTLIELLEAIELYQADRHVPQICSDFVLFEYVYAQNCVIKLLEIFAKKVYSQEIQQHINFTVSEVLRFIESKIVNSKNPNDLNNFDVAIFDLSLKIFTISKDYVKAKKCLELLRQVKKHVNGQPSFRTMRDFVDSVLVQGTGKDLIEVVKTAVAFDDVSVISKASRECELKQTSQNLLDRLEEIRIKNGIILQNVSESSSSSSDSSDDEKPVHE